MYRTLVILRHTFLESIVQPIYTLILALGATVVLIFSALPFFTLGEDTVMFKDVCLDIILLLVLIATLFATSKSIYEEIEDRTMLTLMSKPVRKWEVLLGKYLGIVTSALLAVGVLGIVLILGAWWRTPSDYLLNPRTLDEVELRRIYEIRLMHIMGLVPSLFLIWLEISVLAAVSVAISTRVSLVVNLPSVILIYLAGNLSRFLTDGPGGPLEGRGLIVHLLAGGIKTIIPYLENFDERQRAIYSRIAVPGTVFMRDISAVSLGSIWGYAGYATLYAIAYSALALSIGMLLFQSRELGGGEG
jgi:ABC-type Na+ efflux pump permease subunit